jgi:hypothetical protein
MNYALSFSNDILSCMYVYLFQSNIDLDDMVVGLKNK